MPIAFETVPKEFITKTISYDFKTPITESLASIDKFGAVIVTKNDDYYGIVDDRSLSKDKGLKLEPKTAIGKFAKHTPLLDSSTSINDAIFHFYNSASKALVYTENKKMLGIVRRDAIVRAILSLHLLSDYKVNEVMSTPVIAIEAESTLAQAKIAMNEKKVNRLIVLSNGKTFGIITYKDIMKASTKTPGRLPEYPTTKTNAKVSDLAEKNIYSVDYDEQVENAIRELVENKISSLLITRSGRPVGILTISDLLEAAIAKKGIVQDNIVISGLDDQTKEYEEDIKSELVALTEKVNKFSKMSVSYISLNVKRKKTRNYELKVRISLGKDGVISESAFGYSLDQTLRELIKKLYKSIEEKKEIVVTDLRRRRHKEETEE